MEGLKPAAVAGSATATTPFLDRGETPSVPAGSTTPTSGNVLANAVVPPGASVTVASFTLPGSSTPLTPSSSPVTVTDPVSGKTAGSLVLRPDGSFSFTPAPGYSGSVPPVTYVAACSDGRRVVSSLSFDVLPSGVSGESISASGVRMAVGSTVSLAVSVAVGADGSVPPGSRVSVSGGLGCASSLSGCEAPVAGVAVCRLTCTPAATGTSTITLSSPDGAGGTKTVSVSQEVFALPTGESG